MNLKNLPPFREHGIVAVKLLRGVIYSIDEDDWRLVQQNRQALEIFFSQLRLLLVVDEEGGLAYLVQMEEEDIPTDYAAIPKLFWKTRLTYDQSVLCVLLRERLLQNEEEMNSPTARVVVGLNSLFEQWKTFFPNSGDEKDLRQTLKQAFQRLADLKYVHKVTAMEDTWEIKRIIKARITVGFLEELKEKLLSSRETVQVENDDNDNEQ